MKDKLRFTLYYSGSTFVLNDAPDGWDEELLNFERSEKYHGIFRSGSLNLQFIGDGALILRKAFYSDGVAADVTMKIEYLNTLNMTYETLISGAEFDFLEFDDQPFYVSVKVIQGGLQRIIDSNIDKKYTIPVGSSTYLQYDGVKLYGGDFGNIYGLLDGLDISAAFYHSSVDNLLPWALPQDINTYNDNTQGSFNTFAVSLSLSQSRYDRYFFKANRACNLDLNISAQNLTFRTFLQHDDYNGGTSADTWTFTWYLRVRNAANVTTQEYIAAQTTITPQPGDLTSGYYVRSLAIFPDYDAALDLNAGDKVYLEWDWNPADPNQRQAYNRAGIYVMGLSVTGDIAATLPTVNIYCRTAKTLIEYVLAQIDNTATFESTFLDGLASNEQPLFICGDAARSIVGANYKVSLSELFDALSARYCLGLGVEGTTLKLEEMDYFYDASTRCMNIGEVRNLSIQTLPSGYYGQVVTGWPKQTYDEQNGKDEFNATQTWKIPIDTLENSESRVPSVRADMYGIDFLRINDSSDATADTDSDSDIFMVDAEYVSAGVYKVSRDKFSSITGVNSPETAYNINYSPKRCLLAWGKFVSAFVKTGSLTIGSYDKNVSLSANDGTNTILESDPVLISALDDAIYQPVLLQFEFPQTFATFIQINAEPNGYIEFTWMGNTYKGFIKSASIREARNGILSYTLIAHPDTDLTKLIRM